nr:hypothetical protein [Comamonas testosteroni]
MNAKSNTRGRNASLAAAAAISLAAQAHHAEAASPGMCKVLQVISKKDGFRRAGRAWHGTTTVPLNELTRHQVGLLRSEPMLVILEMEVPEEDVATLQSADRVTGDDADGDGSTESTGDETPEG